MGALIGMVALGGAPLISRSIPEKLARGSSPRMAFSVVRDEPDAFLAVSGGQAGSSENGSIFLVDGDLHGVTGGDRDQGSGALLARAWEQFGEAGPTKVVGDYAAVIHDRSARRIVLIRDHIGTRPLYWRWREGCLLFATHLSHLIDLSPTRVEPDEAGIAAYMRSPHVLGPHRLLKDIKAVEPGHAVVIVPDGPRPLRWWKPEDVPDVRFRNREHYVGALKELIEVAVADRIADPVQIGAHLSGGIDSTTVAMTAERALRTKGRSLSAVYSWSPAISPEAPEIPGVDERTRLAAICKRAGFRLRHGSLSSEDLRRFLARPIEVEGFANVCDEFSILEQAERDGVHLLLSGWGGDEAFSAHAHGVPAWHLRQGNLRELVRLVRANAGLRYPLRASRFLWSDVVVPFLPDALFHRYGPYHDLHAGSRYISSELRRAPELSGLPPRGRFTADPVHDIRTTLTSGHIGERMATWAAWSAPYGIEYRYPLTDRRLLEFILGMPPDILWSDRYPRFLARSASKGLVNGRLSKSDPANGRKRTEAWRGCWKLLAEEASLGRFDSGCDWLDTDALKRDLLRGPSDDEADSRRVFLRAMPAVRIWHMAERFAAAGSMRARRA